MDFMIHVELEDGTVVFVQVNDHSDGTATLNFRDTPGGSDYHSFTFTKKSNPLTFKEVKAEIEDSINVMREVNEA